MDKIDTLLNRHFQFDPLYGLALLKVSQDLKCDDPPGFEKIIDDTLTDFNIERDTFNRYIDKHRDALTRTCQQMGL